MRVRRVLVILVAAALALILASSLLIHTPWARGRVLAWASGFVSRYHLVLGAGGLGYNVITRRVTLTDVRLAAAGHETRPFFVASRIEIRLAWLVYRGGFALDHLEIADAIVDIHRDEHNVVNLPPTSDAPAPERPRRLDIRALTLRGLDLQYTDAARDWGVKVPRIESELMSAAPGAKGSFAVRGPLAVRVRERTMTLAPFETVMTFDGSNVVIENAALVSPEIDAVIAGPINRVLDSPSLDLAIKGAVNLDEAIAWVPPPPVPIAGRATIDGSIEGPAGNLTVALNVASTTLAVGRERDLDLSGPIRVTFDAFSGENLVIAPESGGEIRAAFNVPWGNEVVSTAKAEWSGLDAQAAMRMGNIDRQNLGASFDGSGTFSFGEPSAFTIRTRSTGRGGAGVVPVTGSVDATIVGNDYRFDHDLALPGLTIDGRLSGRINRDAAALTTMGGATHARISDVAAAASSIETMGFAMPEITRDIHGALDAPLKLGGSYRSPQVETAVSSDALTVPFVGRVRASASVVAATSKAVFAKIDVRRESPNTGPTGDDFVLTGDVTADITQRSWTGMLHVESPNAGGLQEGVPEQWRVTGPFSADANLGGTFDAFRLDTTIAGRALTWAGQPVDRVAAQAVVTAESIDVSSLELFQGAGHLEGRVRYAWDTGAYDARLKGERLSWQGTLLTTNDTQAIASVQFEGAGTTVHPKGQARIEFALSGGDAGTLIGAGEATAELTGDQARVVARLPAIGALVNAEIATASPYDYRATAQLDRLELARLSPFIGAIESEILGFATGTVTASGRLADDRDRVALVNITELDAGIGGVTVSLNAPLHVSMRGDDLALKEVFVRVGSGRLSASGEWNTRLNGSFRAQFAGDFGDAIRLGKVFGVPMTLDGSGPLTFEMRSDGTRPGTAGMLSIKNGTLSFGGPVHAVQGLTLDAAIDGELLTISRLSGDVATGGIVGSFAASAAARVPELALSSIDGEFVFDSAKFTFSGIPVAQVRPSRVELSNGALAIADATWAVAENPLIIGGSVGFAAEDPPLDLTVRGLVDLRILTAFSGTVAFDGIANVNTLIKGTVSRPLLDGRILLQDAEIAIAEPRFVISELTGPIALDGRLAVFDGVRGLANGGALALDGSLEFDGAALSGGELNIQAQSVALELPRGLRSELDALVTFRPDPRNPSLTGDIRVVQGAYTETITLAALARQAAQPIRPPTADRPYLERLQMNLSITTTLDLVVDNNYGRLAAAANVRLIGTVAEPGMEGRVSLREGGLIYLAGRTFRITRGDVSFTDRRHIHPEFNITADARLGSGSGTVTMTLTGTLERPAIDLASEDGSSTPGEIAAQIVGSSNTQTALTLLSADLLGVTGRAIGLDAFRVERGDVDDTDFRDYQEDPALLGSSRTDPTTRLTVGKRLSDQVEVTISQNLHESGKATFVVSYFVRPNVELRAISRDSGTLGLGVRHQVTFGGGYSQPPSERRIPLVVSAVDFVDVDPAIAAVARREIKLNVGDDFDFIALQQDIDRIRGAFLAQGYFEARVRTRRIESDDARSVVVEYRVDRGPRTILEVSGFAAPASLLEELTEAWHRNVFDQFLVDDLTHRVRRHLLTTREIGSVVVGRIDRPSSEAKRLRIDVTPGAPVGAREIRFTGNRQLDHARLMSEITAAGLELEAWLDRTVAERALQQVYFEQGYLRATVTGSPLVIEGETGVLAFDITEGPQAQITELAWMGVADTRLAAVQKAAELTTPAPYVAEGLNDARRRVEDYYRQQGFNAAEVDLQSEVAGDDTAIVTFAIEEGPQQVLQTVEMSGLEVTRGTILTEALRFEVGKPVDLDEWALARKRLYDTNVFRLVDVQPVPMGDLVDGVQPVKALVTVEERPEWSFRYGVQLEGDRTLEIDEFTSTKNLGGVAELKNPNLFGRALTFGLSGLYEYDRWDSTVFLGTSRLFGWRARSNLYGFVARERLRDEAGVDITAITERRGVSADQRWRVRGFQIVYGYSFERNRTYDPEPSPDDPLPLDFVASLAQISTATFLDRRDDPINPRRGFFSSLSFDQAAPWLGSDVNNRKLLAQQFVFIPFGPVVLASRIQAGRAFGPDQLLPSDRFRAGGATSVRGYGEDSLGPRSFGVPVGGDKLVVLNQEARFPIYRWARGVAFVDAGNIVGRGEAFDWGQLSVGYGLGLRFDTPVGLLRGDMGFARTPLSTLRGGTPDRVRFYVGFGHIF